LITFVLFLQLFFLLKPNFLLSLVQKISFLF
jgi:hypothetical protein